MTGQGEAGRQAGFAITLRQVLVKVSGDPTLADDPKVAAIAAEPAAFVTGFDYRDRMAGIPVHDEQGTRDRPYELTVSFDHSKVDAALGVLGHAPWPEPRPPLAVFVDVEIGGVTYPLAGDGNAGRDLREALADAAWRFGMTAELPTAAVWASLREGRSRRRRLPRRGSKRRRSPWAAAACWREASPGATPTLAGRRSGR